jgi:diguanylate cyclase (GGDEF)-like protein
MAKAAAPPVMAVVTGVAEYQVRVISGLSQELAEHGIPLLVVTNEPFASEGTPTIILDLIRRRIPRGVIALADSARFRHPELPAALTAARMPTVTLGVKLAGAPRIVADNAAGMRALVMHLVDECGARRLVLVRGVPQHIDSITRERAFRDALAERGIPVDEDLILDGHFRPNTSYREMERLLARRRDFDAVIALNDTSAFGALSAITDQGLRIPDDVLLTGYDNTEGSILTWPPLTTVDQNLAEQGRLAVETLLRLIKEEPVEDDVLVPAHLVVRASTGQEGFAGSAPAGPQLLASQLAELGATARALQTRVAVQDAALYLSWTTSHCRTVDDVSGALEPCLSRLGVPRCFLGIDNAPAVNGGTQPGTDPPSRLILSYRDGAAEAVTGEVFPRHELLPAALRPELDRGVLLLQALSIGGRERGYLLFEPVPQSYLLTEALRIDLPRTIDTLLSSQEMKDHAAQLEDVVALRTQELEEANAELRGFVMRDGLTGIANRIAFQQYLDKVWPPGQEGGRELALLMIDVDLFKSFNDRYGHLAGDDALKTVATCLLRSMRGPEDLACRYGGEEFAVVLPDTGIRAALAVARGFQRILARSAIRHETSTVAPVITVSVGVASTTIAPGADPTDVIAAADSALYQAKLEGRNRIVVAGHGDGVPRLTVLSGR